MSLVSLIGTCVHVRVGDRTAKVRISLEIIRTTECNKVDLHRKQRTDNKKSSDDRPLAECSTRTGRFGYSSNSAPLHQRLAIIARTISYANSAPLWKKASFNVSPREDTNCPTVGSQSLREFRLPTDDTWEVTTACYVIRARTIITSHCPSGNIHGIPWWQMSQGNAGGPSVLN